MQGTTQVRMVRGEPGEGFSRNLAAALDRGWVPHGNPSATYDCRAGRLEVSQMVAMPAGVRAGAWHAINGG